MPPAATPEEQLPKADRAGAASYLAAIVGELAAIAHRHNFETLAHLLDMARLEAEGVVQRLDS